MTATTITELSTADFPASRVSGTGRRKKLAMIRYDAFATTGTIELQNLVPEDTIQIQAVLGDSISTAVATSGSAVTYTGGTALVTGGFVTEATYGEPGKVVVLYDVI